MDTIAFPQTRGSLSALAERLNPSSLVITPNTRLAASVRRQLAQFASQQQTVSAQPKIMPLQQWFDELTLVAQLQGLVSTKPIAQPLEEQALWRAVIDEDSTLIINTKSLAKQAHAASQTLAEWCVDVTAEQWQFDVDPDSRQFAVWQQRYLQKLEQQAWQTKTQVQSQLLDADLGLSQIDIVLLGFYDVSPWQSRLFAKAKHCQQFFLQETVVSQSLIACSDAKQEIQAAAKWLKDTVTQAPDAHIALCVPDLNDRRAAVLAAIDFELQAEATLVSQNSQNHLYNISVGQALLDMPVAGSLVNLMAALKHPLPIDDWQALFYDPYSQPGLGEALTQEIYLLQQFPEPVATAGDIAIWLSEASSFEALYQFAKRIAARQTLPEWYQTTLELIDTAAWLDGRKLTADEYQQQQSVLAALKQAAQLSLPAQKLGYAQWLDLVKDVMKQTVFHRQTPKCAIHILGSLEASGQTFDYLWLCGLEESNWPASLNPNPLIPAAMQQNLQMPRGSSARELAYAQKVLTGFRYAAKQVVFSYVNTVDEVHVAPTPLIPALDSFRRIAPKPVNPDVIAPRLEQVLDEQSRVIDSESSVRAAFIDYQSQCPAKAFYAGRLEIQGTAQPCYGLDAAERGMLMHSAFEAFFTQYPSKASIVALTEQQLPAAIAAAATLAVNQIKPARKRLLPASTLEIEHQRLQSLLGQWLALPVSEQYDFTVAALERSCSFEAAGITVNMRLDRIDQRPEGWLIIDYKSSQQSVSAWFEEPLMQAQLPIYAVALSQHNTVCGIAVATVRQHESNLSVAGAVPALIKKPYEEEAWQQQINQWRAKVIALCEYYSEGKNLAEPSPKACGYCAYQALCREHVAVEPAYVS